MKGCWQSWIALAVLIFVQVVGVVIFSNGFFTFKSRHAGFAEAFPGQDAARRYDRLVFIVIDALRADFVYDPATPFRSTRKLLQDGYGMGYVGFTGHPTVTLPRLKAITTGSEPTFVDAILNIVEGDSSSSLLKTDTWVHQLLRSGKRVVFHGDDTWLRLFPNMFTRASGVSSFYVTDTVEVDRHVTTAYKKELETKDWDAMILHYLGLDHCGHLSGDTGGRMTRKQEEMDTAIQTIYRSLSNDSSIRSLMIVIGDHGMTRSGNHGGSSKEERSAALLFLSTTRVRCESSRAEVPPIESVSQIDVVSTLSMVLGLPTPLNNEGTPIASFLQLQNEGFDLVPLQNQSPGIAGNRTRMIDADHDELQAELVDSSRLEHRARSRSDPTARSEGDYNLFYMRFGTLIMLTHLVISWLIGLASSATGHMPNDMGIVMAILLLQGVSLFASSYVENESWVWYQMQNLLFICRWLSPSKSPFRAVDIGRLLLFRLLQDYESGKELLMGFHHTRVLARSFPTLSILVLATLQVKLWRCREYTAASNNLRIGCLVMLISMCEWYLLCRDEVLSCGQNTLVPAARCMYLAVLCLLIMCRQDVRTIRIALVMPIVCLQKPTNAPLLLIALLLATLSPNDGLLLKTGYSHCVQRLLFFACGGSNSLSSIDLSNAYVGTTSYSLATCVLVFLSNWGVVVTFNMSMVPRLHRHRQREASRSLEVLWAQQMISAIPLVMSVMACLVFRHHLFIWSVFTPKLLFEIVWMFLNGTAVSLLCLLLR